MRRQKILLSLLCAGLMAFFLPMEESLAAAGGKAARPLTSDETEDLLFMREEEKVARDVYITLHEPWGNAIFANISTSEQRHMDAILKLLNKYKLSDPAAGKLIGEFTDTELQALYAWLIEKGMASEEDALEVGGIIEETDMEDIMEAIEDSKKPDIDSTYESLLCGSRNHLRSFAASLEALTGLTYAAQVLDQAEVDAILDEPMENCGK